MEPPTNACWKRRAALKGTSGISARSSVHHDSLSVRPRQPEVSVFPRDATLRFAALAAVFRLGEPRTVVRMGQGALVANRRRGRQKSRRVGFFAITLCGSAFPNRGEKSKSSSSFRRSPAPSKTASQDLNAPIKALGASRGIRPGGWESHRLRSGLVCDTESSVRGLPMDCIHAKHGILPFSLGRPPSAGAYTGLRPWRL
jgi:hypothetical protein